MNAQRLASKLATSICMMGFLASTEVARPTTLVGIWTEHKITIAADSKQTISRGHRVVGSQAVCKIYKAGNGLTFAFAGLANSEAIDVVKAVRDARPLRAMGTGKPLPLETLIVGAESGLVKILRARRETDDNSMSVGMIIAGEIDGKLQMIRIENWGIQIAGDFSFAKASRRIAYPDSRGHDGTDPNRGIEVVGFDGAIKRWQTTTPNWSVDSDAKLARNLIVLETEDGQDSKFVGMPITELEVTERGVKWIARGACR